LKNGGDAPVLKMGVPSYQLPLINGFVQQHKHDFLGGSMDFGGGVAFLHWSCYFDAKHVDVIEDD
jgi:hypothetical protein